MNKFKFSEKDSIFFTSDTHFNHKNIIKYCNRPFSSVEDHDKALIDNWNSVVPPNATVFHLGDFAFAGSDYTTKVLNQLNGHIVLIKGNHDHFQDSFLNKFDAVYPQLHIEIGNKHVYLNHYPFLTYSGMYRSNPVIELFGHCHSGTRSLSGNDITKLDILSPYQLDVGVDNFDYKPVSWNQVKEAIEWQVRHKIIYAKRNLTRLDLFLLKIKKLFLFYDKF